MERLQINYATRRELAEVPGIDYNAAKMNVSVREGVGRITPKMFCRIPQIKHPEAILGYLDFRPFESDEAEDDDDFEVRPPRASSSSAGPSWATADTEFGGTQDNRTVRMSHPYPYECYPPPSQVASQAPYTPDLFSSDSPGPSSRYPGPAYGHTSSARIPPRQPSRPSGSRRGTLLALMQRRPQQPPMPKSISYDGTGKWHTFYFKFDAFAQQYNWSGERQKHEMNWCLQGTASDYYTALWERNPRAHFRDLITQMKKRFEGQEPLEVAHMEFVAAKQAPNESLQDWADRVASIARRAFPGIEESQVSRQITLRFLDSRRSTEYVNPKKAGSFDPISQPGGGGGFHPPLGSRPRSDEKLCNLAHT